MLGGVAYLDLADGVIELHIPRHADARAIVDCEDGHIRRWWNQSEPLTLSVARERVRTAKSLHERDAGDWRLTIRRTAGSRLIGWLRVHRCDPIGETPSEWHGPSLSPAAMEPGAEVELWLCPTERDVGIGKRAMALACRFAFERLGVPWLKGEIQPENSASFHLAVRSFGFEPTGRSGPLTRDPTISVVEYWLTADKWRRQSP
jgi:RimJ/RimL family protein N-acetyltransferase